MKAPIESECQCPCPAHPGMYCKCPCAVHPERAPVTDAELDELERHHLVGSSEWLRPRVEALVAEVRRLRADTAAMRAVQEELEDWCFDGEAPKKIQRLMLAERVCEALDADERARQKPWDLDPDVYAALEAWRRMR
jgi:hypothetical protein